MLFCSTQDLNVTLYPTALLPTTYYYLDPLLLIFTLTPFRIYLLSLCISSTHTFFFLSTFLFGFRFVTIFKQFD